MKTPFKFLCLVAVTVTLYACQKELTDPNDPGSQPPANPCRIAKSFYFGGGGMHDSAVYTYVNGKVARLDREEDYVEYFYDGNNIKAMKYYEKQGNTLIRVDSFYFTNNKLAKISSHDNDWPNNFDTTYSILNFQYNGDQLGKVIHIENYISGGSVFMSDTLETQTIYNSSGNISTIVNYYVSAQAYDTAYYDYDTKPNYFTALHPYFFMVDPFFRIQVGFESHLPYFLSKNNVINFRIYNPAIDYPIEYETDSLNHPTAVNQGGFEYMKYEYQCN